jgi:NAD(P)-dependent dehydrogenase (short-subunit alcohol dehydrogenase family)
MASIVSGFATPTALAYGASKAAVEQLTRSMALFGGREGKRVRCNLA